MALTRANVRVAVTGGVYRGVSGTTVPTTVDGVLNVALKDQGYVGEDGITQSIDQDTTDITAWQNSDIVREVQTSHKLTYQLKLIEVNPETLETVYGNHAAGTTLITGATLPAVRVGVQRRGRREPDPPGDPRRAGPRDRRCGLCGR
jgi:hypothetical protein